MSAHGPRRAARRTRAAVPTLGLSVLLSAALGAGQLPSGDASAQRVNERIRALEREAADLAGQSRTLLGELRALEIERDLKTQEARAAERAAVDARVALQLTAERMTALERERIAQLPNLEAQLVDVYKNGRTGHARLLFDAGGLRQFARATRAVAAMVTINQRRIDEHRRLLAAIQRERAALEERARTLLTRDGDARAARARAERAVAAHAARIDQIDARRDLTAQYVGELQAAFERLQPQQTGTAPAAVAAVPLSPFRGALAWPLTGTVTGRFGQAEGRLGGTAVRNGMEISAPEGTAVQAIHGGTVSFAEAFTGLGTLVIVDHGANNYSLYGYLGAATVQRGDLVSAGAPVGRVGMAPAGPTALYFEMRIDGRSVDPLQWLAPAGNR